MARTPAAVQTPGEAPAADQPSPDAAAPAAGLSPDSDNIDDLRALVKQQAEQMSAMMAAVTQMQANQSRAVPSQSMENSLPDIADVDLAKINAGQTPVLTKQGWVVPATFGTDPARLQELKDMALQREFMAASIKNASK
jgi:hypothetical protein